MNSTTIENLRHLARFTESKEQWKLLSLSSEWLIRMSAVRNIYLSEDSLQDFLEDDHQEVRCSVAICTKSAVVLRKLMDDPHYIVRSAVLQNYYVPKDLIEQSLKDSARTIREQAEMLLMFPRISEPRDLNSTFMKMKNNEERLSEGVLSIGVRETLIDALDPKFPQNLPNKLSAKNQLSLALNPYATFEQLKALTSKEAISAAEYNPKSKE